jgi:hypothetical protein
MSDPIAMLQAEELRKRELEILRQKVQEQQKIIEDLQAENTKLIVKIKMQREQLITQNEYIDRMDDLARKGRERIIE